MDRLESMRAFVEAVRLNGFSAAARSLQLPRSTVSKRIQALEAHLGVQLLMRTTRSLHLTEAGRRYFEAAQELLHDAERADELAREGSISPRGTLRINAPASFGLRVLGPLLPRFHALHPEVELQVALDDQQVDPVRGGFDLTIRIADLPDSSMVARAIMPAPRWLVASPGFLAGAGHPDTAETMERYWLGYGSLGAGSAVTLIRGDERVRMQGRGPFSTDNSELLVMMAEAGMGLTLLPEFIVGEAVAAGRLVRLPEWSAPELTVHAVHLSARRVPLKTRAFIDFLLGSLGGGTPAT